MIIVLGFGMAIIAYYYHEIVVLWQFAGCGVWRVGAACAVASVGLGVTTHSTHSTLRAHAPLRMRPRPMTDGQTKKKLAEMR